MEDTCSARPAAETFMKHAVSSFGLAALGAVALYNAPAVAQEQARAQAIQVYSGELFGNRLTDMPLPGRAPVAGAGYAWALRYGNGVTANLGIGTKDYVTTNLFWDLGIRYRYLDRVVSLELTLLTTAGAGTA
jgi:hypothetical protein